MSDDKDGGAAFPTPENEYQHHVHGMSLRDWFAGMALQGLCVSDRFQRNDDSNKSQAVWAYELADAMLAARKAKP